MGGVFSELSSPSPSIPSQKQNPKSGAALTTTAAAATMAEAFSDKPINPETEPPKTLNSNHETQNPDEKSKDTQNPDHNSTDTENPDQKPTDTGNPDQESENKEGEEEEEEEEEGECGFCLFMKGGECRETFINWEKCVEEGEKNEEDIVEKCYEVTLALKKCMEANQDYYGMLLQAEKDAEQQVMNQLEQEKQEEKEKEKGVAEQEEEVNSGEQEPEPKPKHES